MSRNITYSENTCVFRNSFSHMNVGKLWNSTPEDEKGRKNTRIYSPYKYTNICVLQYSVLAIESKTHVCSTVGIYSI